MKAEVVIASSDLRWRKRSCAGAPMLVIDGTVQPIASLWLLDLWFNKTSDTVRTYAQQAKSWWKHLDHLKRTWWSVSSDDLIEFRHILSERGISTASINVATAAVMSFYSWAHQQGYLYVLPFKSGSRLSPPSHTGTIIRRLKVHRKPFNVHSQTEFDAILAASPRSSPGLLLRDELIGEVGRYLGLRAQEAAGLNTRQFTSIDVDREVHLIPLDPNTTKGRKARSVLAKRDLVRKIVSYVEVVRAITVFRRKKRDPHFADHGMLFVKANGNPVPRTYVSALWSVCARRAGIPARYHDNRHAMATVVSRRCEAAGEHPLALPGDLLGHADDATTLAYIENLSAEERAHIAQSLAKFIICREQPE